MKCSRVCVSVVIRYEFGRFYLHESEKWMWLWLYFFPFFHFFWEKGSFYFHINAFLTTTFQPFLSKWWDAFWTEVGNCLQTLEAKRNVCFTCALVHFFFVHTKLHNLHLNRMNANTYWNFELNFCSQFIIGWLLFSSPLQIPSLVMSLQSFFVLNHFTFAWQNER